MLHGADLQESYIGGADFSDAALDRCDLRDVDAIGLSNEEWDQVEPEVVEQVPEGTLRTAVLERLKEARKRGPVCPRTLWSVRGLSLRF